MANYFADREILEHLGRALYECQRLELLFSMIVEDLHIRRHRFRGKSTLERLEEFQRILDSEREKKRTLGQLHKELLDHVRLPDAANTLLTDAFKSRNEIIHRFFYKHVCAFIADGGRHAILEDLKNSVDTIHAAYELGKKIAQQLKGKLASGNSGATNA